MHFCSSIMKVILIGLILGVVMIEANGYNDNEMKAKLNAMEKHQEATERRLAKMDAMEKRLAKMDAMEKRLAVVEQQEGTCLFTLNWSKYDDEKW